MAAPSVGAPKPLVPLAGPFRDLGRRLPSSLRAVNDALTDSWLLLLPASLLRAAWLADRPESKLPTGDDVPLMGRRAEVRKSGDVTGGAIFPGGTE